MKSILFITVNNWSAWGGSELLWLKAAEYCSKQNLRVGVGIRDWDPMPEQIKNLQKNYGVSLILNKTTTGLLTRAYNKIAPAQFKSSNLEVYKQNILAWKPDLAVVSQGDNKAGVDMMLFLAKHGIRYVSVSHCVVDQNWPEYGESLLMEGAYGKSQQNYFVSNANLTITKAQVGGNLNNAKVIRNPFNVPYENDIAFPGCDYYKLASVARYDFGAKGQDVLLQVMSEQKWRQRNIQINFYGTGRQEKLMDALIKHYNLTNTIIKGHCSTVNIWQDNHALIMSSRYEGLPLVLVEAMLCKRFGIVTDAGGSKEVIEEDVNGFVAEAPLAVYVDNAMERAWQRRGEWQEIGEKARAHVTNLVPADPIAVFYDEIMRVVENGA